MTHRQTTSRSTRPAAKPSARTRSAARVRIVVADHQAIDRAGIVRLLEGEADFEIVGETTTVEDSIAQCRALEPDLLVLTLNLPAESREAAIPAIRAQLPGLRILALSERGAENCLVLNPPSRKWLAGVPLGTCPVGIDCLQLAAQQGAMGTLRRSADPQELFRAIRDVARGRASYDPTTATGMLDSTGRDGGGRRLFSDRETQVAALITEAQSNKEIASLLGIGEPTVKKHVGNILEKLGLQDRLQAGLFLARNPLILKR
jgi:DNA-binding NarL/FixJ family response regulator